MSKTIEQEPVKAVYEKYKHLDQLLSDPYWVGVDKDSGDGHALRHAMFDMWGAIKQAVKPPVVEAGEGVEMFAIVRKDSKSLWGALVFNTKKDADFHLKQTLCRESLKIVPVNVIKQKGLL